MSELPKVTSPLYESYHIDLSDSEKTDLEAWIGERLEDAITSKTDLDEQIEIWRNTYSAGDIDREPAFEGGSNTRIPVARMMVDALLFRLFQSHFGVEPYIRVNPISGTHLVDTAKALETALDYVNKMSKFADAGYLTIKDSLITGTGICKTVWEQDWKLVSDGGSAKYVLRYNLPRTIHIPTEDFIIYPSNNVDIDDADIVGHKFFKRWDGLQRGVSLGLYNKDWVEELEGKSGASTSLSTDTNAVLNTKDTGIDWKDEPFELYELIVSYDFDDDGLNEDYLVTFDRVNKKIIRFMSYPIGFGERWYHSYVPSPVSNSFYGESMIGLLDAIDEEITTLHNQRIDNTTLVNMPMYKCVVGSPAFKDKEKAYPGKIWPVTESDELTPLIQVPPLRDNYLQDEQRLFEYAKFLSGQSEINLGGLADSTGRTAYEIEAALAEGSVRIRLQVGLGVEWLRRIAWQQIGLLKQFMPDETFERITQFPDFLNDTPWEDLWNNFDLMPYGNTTTSNRELERQKAVFLREAMKNDPLLFSVDPATGQTIPKPGWYEIDKLFLLAHDVDQFQKVIGEAPEQQAIGQDMMQQQMPGSSQMAMPNDLEQVPGQEQLMALQQLAANAEAIPGGSAGNV